MQDRKAYLRESSKSGIVLRRDKYPVYNSWQGKAGVVWHPSVCQSGTVDFHECGEGKMPGTAAGSFAVIRVMIERTFTGRIGCNGTMLRTYRKHLAGVTEA
jgi:hypothetical protein